MLDSVSRYISDIESSRRIIGSIINDTNTYLDKENSLPKIESNIDLIEKYVYVINFRLYEYGRTKEGYTYINMAVMRPLLGSFSNFKQDFYKVKKDSSNNYAALKDSELEFTSRVGRLEDAILEKKTEVRSVSA